MTRSCPFLDTGLPIAFAHRGGAGAGGENTVEAFGRAVAQGYRYLETDVHATADGVAVVFHDETLQRLCGRPERVGDLRWSDLATLRVSGAGVIPRLDEVLRAWPETRFNIDVKSNGAVTPTVRAIRRDGAEDRVLLASFSDARLRAVRREFGTRVATSLGMWGIAALWAGAGLGLGRRLPPDVVAAQVPTRYGGVPVLGPSFVRYCHELGLQVHVWTVDEPELMHRLLDMGVDGIMTDRLEVLAEVYAERGHPLR